MPRVGSMNMEKLVDDCEENLMQEWRVLEFLAVPRLQWTAARFYLPTGVSFAAFFAWCWR